MPLDGMQGHNAAPEEFWPCTGRTGGFEIPSEMAEISRAKDLIITSMGSGQQLQHGVSSPDPVAVIDQLKELPDQVQLRVLE
ncbi:MAG: hypothetical protein PSV23_02020 [Brevundimonas sp.]|uniref:hypothetical protein n=1 Tax=Brevundimonas sp. TaxID=1871086 RepID=UPI002487D96F|nr:hypothetical protein [Brevundimonas sp.]MDI1325554.1 hypothetical protein [Brevundimonas sp.]